MAHLNEIVEFCNAELDIGAFDDYCPNGLQVEGRAEVGRVVSGVTASQTLLDAAVTAGADIVLVHHGYFWRNEPAPLVGIKGRRIRTLIGAGMSLLAYHLPLDAHQELGNNRQLGDRLGL
ncbi:MAG: Nif3-like dinuclear metal center hexameric protein, partial [Gammaproteobacteria bacterium]|nr:Nif3-like dinuclear metal center hexameric protein [Gammaproteobacteria bacterium]